MSVVCQGIKGCSSRVVRIRGQRGGNGRWSFGDDGFPGRAGRPLGAGETGLARAGEGGRKIYEREP